MILPDGSATGIEAEEAVAFAFLAVPSSEGLATAAAFRLAPTATLVVTGFLVQHSYQLWLGLPHFWQTLASFRSLSRLSEIPSSSTFLSFHSPLSFPFSPSLGLS